MKERINLAEYRDRVLGCWTGKNAGGTLGAPMEGRRELFDIDFYTQDLAGQPAPNDDLDLQLVWLLAAEERGTFHLNERILGEYWMTHITGPWNEYGVGKLNIANGLYPPLSGVCNNERWQYSNGAWIRSEIWACLFPGSPDLAARYAWCDACVDHAGEGIYAEMFTAALESAAFVEQDIPKLIEIALARIPPDCRIARDVKLVCDEFAKGADWRAVRNAVVAQNADLGWFQAPANVAFTILGLLYGGGDFGRTMCLAVNCGDDTDCTGATAGAVMGIRLGRSGIPRKWTDPIGESIRTVAVNPFHLSAPQTLMELTDRVVRVAQQNCVWDPGLPELSSAATAFSDEFRAALTQTGDRTREWWTRSSRAMDFDLPYGVVTVEYPDGVECRPGEVKRLNFILGDMRADDRQLRIRPVLPEGWTAEPAEISVQSLWNCPSGGSLAITCGAMPADAVFQFPCELHLAGRFNPVVIQLPFQAAGSVFPIACPDRADWRFWEAQERLNRRRKA